MARRLALIEPVGVCVPANNVAALRARRELGPLAGVAIYFERPEAFVCS